MFFDNDYYYITIILQAVCVFHCLKKGNQQRWIWVIIFLPVIGCLIYFFSEVVTGSEVQRVSSGVGSVINPGGTVKRLEGQLKFSDTHQNKVALADAYLQKGDTTRAIQLYEESRTGVFTDNEHVLFQLVLAYAKINDWPQVIQLANKLSSLPQFTRSKAPIAYANALFMSGNNQQAESEFLKMKGKFSNYESRYYYGMFLIQTERTEQAALLFKEIIGEEKHLGSREKNYHKTWINKIKEALKNLEVRA